MKLKILVVRKICVFVKSSEVLTEIGNYTTQRIISQREISPKQITKSFKLQVEFNFKQTNVITK